MRWLCHQAIQAVVVGILGCLVHADSQFKKQSDDYYNYVEHISAGTVGGLKTAVRTFYEQMAAEHEQFLVDYPFQPVMAAGMVVNNEYWIASSGSYQPGFTKLSTAYPSNFPDTLK